MKNTCFLTELDCRVRNLAYDFESRTGRLDMPPVCCCDMSGCINLFRAIDPDVRRIETYSGGLRDTFYERNGEDQWRALTHDGRRFEWNSFPRG